MVNMDETYRIKISSGQPDSVEMACQRQNKPDLNTLNISNVLGDANSTLAVGITNPEFLVNF